LNIFKRLLSPGPKEIHHPILGRISRQARSRWLVTECDFLGSVHKPFISLAGDHNGPFPECVSTYQRLRDDWERIRSEVANDVFELNQNYFSDQPSLAMKSPDQAQLLQINICAESRFSFTFHFHWQNPRDGHEITIYFENWQSAGSSIDG